MKPLVCRLAGLSVLAALILNAAAPPAVAAESVDTRNSLFSEFRSDFATISSDPVFYGLTVGMFSSASVLGNEDPEINEAWAGEGGTDHLFEFGDRMGNALYPMSAAVLSYGTGRLFNSPAATSFASDLFRAQVLNGIATISLKRTIHRRRPDGSAWSFPSGHTSTAFATAAVIDQHFGWKFGLPAFVAASYVGLSRLQENRHYLSDVVAGAALGGYIGFRISRKRRSGNMKIAAAPFRRGVELSLRF